MKAFFKEYRESLLLLGAAVIAMVACGGLMLWMCAGW